MTKPHYETNTWPERHSLPLQYLKQALLLREKKNISVRIIGPGGIAEEYRDKLPRGDEETFAGSFAEIFQASDVWGNIARKARRTGQQWVNRSESPARDKLTTPLTCFEPLEVYKLLEKDIGISYLEIVDKYPRVLEGVSRLNLPNVKIVEGDIQDLEHSLREVDVVIALRVLQYCARKPEAAYKNVIEPVKDGGLTVLTVPEGVWVPEGFTQVWPGIESKVRKPERRLYWKGERERKIWSGREAA